MFVRRVQELTTRRFFLKGMVIIDLRYSLISIRKALNRDSAVKFVFFKKTKDKSILACEIPRRHSIVDDRR